MPELGNAVLVQDTFPGRLSAATVSPRHGQPPLREWLSERHGEVAQLLRERGAILFRGFLAAETELESHFLKHLVREPIGYQYRSTPRSSVGANTYTATEYNPALTIPLHNENSYQRDWPMTVLFYSSLPAESGGATLLADTHEITDSIGARLIERWSRHGLTYIRNYHPGVDLHWRTAFQTDSPAEVEAYCRSKCIEFRWNEDGSLRTEQRCHVVAVHPRDGSSLWFNQAHLFHSSSLGADVERDLRTLYGDDGLPRDVVTGDGRRLASDDLSHIRAAYERSAVPVHWEKDDLLVMDNMRFAHGRASFRGRRRLLFAMGDSYSQST